MPPQASWPEGSEGVAGAVRTPFRAQGGRPSIVLHCSRSERPSFVEFALVHVQTSRWDSRGGANYRIELPAVERTAKGSLPAAPATWPPVLEAITAELVERETSGHSWSLMHRFHLAHDLLARLSADDERGLAVLFVWLRFSALRQLDWQRKFNTKPRELAHAQDRLTRALAVCYARDGAARHALRALARTVGRGGNEGQRVRDGILEIMHRHHVKEVAGHFLEEWHQKLHNNTTPDDVVICEAYLAFLRHHGDRTIFYSTLESAGVTRERLKSYERPLRSDPDYVPHLRDGLLHDFEEFLAVLRAVHSATDLKTAIQAASGSLDERSRELLQWLWDRRDEAAMQTWLLETVTRLREGLRERLGRPAADGRELLYLDLALEDFLRIVVERQAGDALPMEAWLHWTSLVLTNLELSRPCAELALACRHLQRVMGLPRSGREWALHARAVLERLRGALTSSLDEEARILQPLAESLGGKLGVEDWVIRIFSEEVLRGGLDFTASAAIRHLDERLRASAGMGAWLVVSRGRGSACGLLASSPSLAATQGRRFSVDTILVTDEVRGEEDLPEGVVAVLTRSDVDLLSHAAVRARNEGVFMATCWDAIALAALHARQGEPSVLRMLASGDVLIEPSARAPAAGPTHAVPRTSALVAPTPPTDVFSIAPPRFLPGSVGSKSRNLQALRHSLPDGIDVPRSAALPFGVCERVLKTAANAAVAAELQSGMADLARLHAMPARSADEHAQLLAQLGRLRQAMQRLVAPPELESELRATLREVGLALDAPWADAWRCITGVWASKWNERAYWSRVKNGIDHDSLVMAVLIQEVVPSEYAFVLHTANPTTGDRDELYGELVAGLGETLVGNFPGRALGFTSRRGEQTPRLISFPSKSTALYGGHLIFRSDSNGEDLAELAGAGLYDSLVLPPARARAVDYTQHELLWNEDRLRRILCDLAELGRTVEARLGGPQDIEGAYANGRFSVVQSRPQVGVGT